MFTIIVNTRREFIHRYRKAPEEVAFLQNWHRHMLHITVELSVDHAERDLEFFMVQRQINHILDNEMCLQYVECSCETVAMVLTREIIRFYGDRDIIVTVMEDGEVGGRLTHRKEEEI